MAARQDDAFAPLLERMRRGDAREDFAALAEAVRRIGQTDPFIVEVGCASGWNFEVLTRLVGPVRYAGVDCARPMLRAGRARHGGARFVAGDAGRLPLKDRACDILVSGTVLMHLMDWRRALAESRRVTRRWVVLHTVPVLQRRETTRLTKSAYGGPVAEIIFNERELTGTIEAAGLQIRSRLPSLPYNLESVLGEPTTTYTYVCEAT